MFYIYKFRLLQIQEFRTLSIFIPISCLLTIHPESWAREIKNHKRAVLRKLERSNCVPSFPQVGILVPVYQDYLFLTRSGHYCPAYMTHTENRLSHSPILSLFGTEENTQRLYKKRVEGKGNWKGMGNSKNSQKPSPKLSHYL